MKRQHTELCCVSILSHLVDDFSKLLQGGAHHLVVAPERKTLQQHGGKDEVDSCEEECVVVAANKHHERSGVILKCNIKPTD